MVKLVRKRGKGLLKASTFLIIALLTLADAAESFRYLLLIGISHGTLNLAEFFATHSFLPSLHYGFATAYFHVIIPGFNVSIFQGYYGALETLYFSGKFEAIQNYGNGELQRLMMRTLTGLNSSIQTNLNT